MSTATTHLNLARKWRSKQFDQIVGQDLSVRMLKNSLYLNHFFPVYLFSGQRGCGKTTTARVFASAINCEKLDAFKLEPKKFIIPCLSCASCQAMLAGKHPDFIEMDAASHTGVDNVRNIIDAASLMPIMGRKKIYLIDEAHMLSKAAFNAFLKIMEEPPASVIFILATTDSQKIIDTVRSRCFQLFFKPIESDVLLNHLEEICKQEGIAYEIAGLQMIVKETEGSARDALNMLETVRFSAAQVTQNAVFQVLGHVQEEQVIGLLEGVLLGKQHQIVDLLKTIDASQKSISFLWQNFLQLLHTCIWLKHDVQPDQFVNHIKTLKQLIRSVHWLQLHTYLHTCYKNEQTFLKTVNQRAFFEMILLQLSVQHKATEGNDSGSGFSSMPGIVSPTVSDVVQDDETDDQDDEEEEEESNDDLAHFDPRWKAFINDIILLEDHVLTSIFKQAQFRAFDQVSGKLELVLNRRFTFFQDHLDNTKTDWYKLFQKQFGDQVACDFQFTAVDQEPLSTKKVEAIASPISLPKKEQVTQQVSSKYNNMRQSAGRDAHSFARYNNKKRENLGPILDIKDKELWKKTHMLLQYFPGTVHEIQQVKI